MQCECSTSELISVFKNQSEICFSNYLWQVQQTKSSPLKNQSAIFFENISGTAKNIFWDLCSCVPSPHVERPRPFRSGIHTFKASAYERRRNDWIQNLIAGYILAAATEFLRGITYNNMMYINICILFVIIFNEWRSIILWPYGLNTFVAMLYNHKVLYKITCFLPANWTAQANQTCWCGTQLYSNVLAGAGEVKLLVGNQASRVKCRGKMSGDMMSVGGVKCPTSHWNHRFKIHRVWIIWVLSGTKLSIILISRFFFILFLEVYNFTLKSAKLLV